MYVELEESDGVENFLISAVPGANDMETAIECVPTEYATKKALPSKTTYEEEKEINFQFSGENKKRKSISDDEKG